MSRCCCLLAILFFGFPLLAISSALTCTYLVVVYIPIRVLLLIKTCFHLLRICYLPFPFPLSLIPLIPLHRTRPTTLNPIFTVTCTCAPLPSTHLLTLTS